MGRVHVHLAESLDAHEHRSLLLARNVEKLREPRLESTDDLVVNLLSIDRVKELLRNDEIKQSLTVASPWQYFAENQSK